MKKFKHVVSAALFAATSALAYVPAHAAGIYQEFTVSENGGAVQAPLLSGLNLLKTFTVDEIKGGYNEAFTVTSPTTFRTTAYADLTGFFANDGKTSVPSFLNAGSIGYGIYAIFEATGNILGNTFVGSTGSIKVYLDNYALSGGTATTKSFIPGTDSLVVTDTGSNDALLASTSSFLFGAGHTYPGDVSTPNGDFSLTFTDFALTPTGSQYFTAPNPFLLTFTIDGNFGSFPVPTSGTTYITGATNVFFPVPEPDSVALFGIALAGLAVASRRRRNV